MGADAGQCAAFSVAGPRGETLAILAEIPRRTDTSILPDLARRLRRAIIEVHEVDPRHVLLVRQATVPLTSSGKIQRNRCREMLEANEFEPKYRYDRSGAGEESPLPLPDLSALRSSADRQAIERVIEDWMTQWLVARAGLVPGQIDRDQPLSDYGLDSLTAVELSGEIEDWSDVICQFKSILFRRLEFRGLGFQLRDLVLQLLELVRIIRLRLRTSQPRSQSLQLFVDHFQPFFRFLIHSLLHSRRDSQVLHRPLHSCGHTH